MRTRTFRATALSVLACFSLVAAACGDDDDDDAGGAEGTTAEGTTAPEGTTAEGTTAEGTAAGTTAAEGTTAPGETSPPTAPARGDADLVIWSDDTRQAVVQGIADVFAEENGITVVVQEVSNDILREQFNLTAPTGEGPDIVVGANDWIGELSTNGVLEPHHDPQPRRLRRGGDPGVHVRRHALRRPVRDREHRPHPQHRAGARGAGDVGGDGPDRHRLQGAVPRRPDPARPRRAGRRRGRPLPLPADAVGVRRLHARAERGRHVQHRGRRPRLAGRARSRCVPRRGRGVRTAQPRRRVRHHDHELRRGQGPVRDHRPVGHRRGRPRLRRHRCALRGHPDPRPRGRRAARRVRRRAGLHGVVVLRAEGPRPELRPGLHDPAGHATGDVRGRRRAPAHAAAFDEVSSDPDVAGFGESGAAGIPLPVNPEIATVFTEVGLAEANVLRGADPTTEFTNAANAIRDQIGG